MLVDFGADISIIPRWTGRVLGLRVDENDYIKEDEGTKTQSIDDNRCTKLFQVFMEL